MGLKYKHNYDDVIPAKTHLRQLKALVIPAKAGIHPCTHRNVRAKMDSRLRGNDIILKLMPGAFAGMT